MDVTLAVELLSAAIAGAWLRGQVTSQRCCAAHLACHCLIASRAQSGRMCLPAFWMEQIRAMANKQNSYPADRILILVDLAGHDVHREGSRRGCQP